LPKNSLKAKHFVDHSVGHLRENGFAGKGKREDASPVMPQKKT
jgi:hypothetical protein